MSIRSGRRDASCSSLLLVLLVALLLTWPGCARLRSVGEPTSTQPFTPAWELPPPPLKVGPVIQAGRLGRSKLSNELEILVLEDRRLPLVSLALTVRRGAGAVDRERAGLAEFTAELMNRGAGDRDAMALAEAVDDLGASLSVSAGWDSMQVSISGLSRDLDELLEILGDVALSPRFDAEEAQKTQREQLAGLEAAKDSPATMVSWHANRVLYPAHRYGVPLKGTPGSVASLSVEAARELHAAYFVPNNAILSISGSVDPEAWKKLAEDAFGSWKRGPVPASAPAPPAPTPAGRKIVIVDKPDLVQSRIIIAHEGIDRTDDRRIAAALMNDTLGGSGFSSRMMKTLRSNEGLTYSVHSGYSLRRRPGPFSVSTFTRVPQTRESVDILLAEMEAIHGSRPPSEDELGKAKSYNVGQFGLGLETSAALMGSLVGLAVHDLPIDSLDTYRSRVQAVTAADVAQVARDLLHPDRAAIVLLGPAEALAQQFEGLGEVTVVQP